MATKQKSGKLTIANIVAIVGVVLLLVFSFLGRSYMSGGELGWDIFIAVAITAFTVVLLWFLIKAKGAENHLSNWKKAEYVVLAIYIIFAIPASLFGGIMNFFVVNDQKERIMQYAQADLQKIDKMFAEYRDFEEDAINITCTGLTNAIGLNAERGMDLTDFMQRNNIKPDIPGIDIFRSIRSNELLGDGFQKFQKSQKDKLNEINSIINSWSVMQIPYQAERIDELAEDVSKKLCVLSNSVTLPVIGLTSGGVHDIKQNNQVREFKIDGGVDSFEFKKHITDARGFSATALLVVIIIHFMILFNYIVAYRTSTVTVGKCAEEDGGRILD